MGQNIVKLFLLLLILPSFLLLPNLALAQAGLNLGAFWRLGQVSSIGTYSKIAAGGHHSCAVGTNGELYCWGRDYNYQLGNDNVRLDKNLPVLVDRRNLPANAKFLDVAGSYYHTCALVTGGDIYCWGGGTKGELGIGAAVAQEYYPRIALKTQLPVGVTYASVTLGHYFSCSIATNDEAYCWGDNAYGQLGINSPNIYEYRPSLVVRANMPNGVKFKDISAGYRHACGVGTNNEVYCWGQGEYSQLGNGLSTGVQRLPGPINRSNVPVGVGFVAVAAGMYHSCAVTTVGTVFCWGNGTAGQHGDGSTAERSIPIAINATNIPVGVNFVDISVGSSHTCALAGNGEMYCWGSDGSGQVGNGTLTQPNATATLVNKANFPAGVNFSLGTLGAMGESHSCGLGSNNRAYCWGTNQYKQLGYTGSSNMYQHFPVPVNNP